MALEQQHPISVDEIDTENERNRMELDENIIVGMKVNSEEEAFDLYNRHALRKGFSVRRGNKRKINGVVRQREFLCSKQGRREDTCDVKKINRLETRTECKARIRFTISKDNIWEVSSFNDEHNHDFADEDEKHNLRSGRKILDAQAAVLCSMVGSGIKPVKSYHFLAKEVGGIKNVGFTEKDCHNFLHSVRKTLIEAGDGQSVINHFKHKQVEDPLFFYSVQVDQENRMTNFFWRDGRSKLDYDCFGDVVVFDTTFRTNRYNLICAPFVGVNHHRKNVLFGCAFLLDETTESFVWLFETFLEAMGGRQPKTIFTDQDQAMANAIKKVFPESRHRLCLWHISMNAKKHLAGIIGNAEFNNQFQKCLCGCLDENEFQSTWNDMIHKYKLEDNGWLKRLYECRDKWCTSLSKDIFSAEMKSTQRSESMNNVFHQVLGTSLTLTQVVQYYEEKVEYIRQKERDDDFNCKNGSLGEFISHGGLLGHAASIYTLSAFPMFKKQYLIMGGLSCNLTKKEDVVHVYEVQKPQGRRVKLVKFDQSNSTVFVVASCLRPWGFCVDMP